MNQIFIWMGEILSSIDFWKFVLPLFGAVVAWFINEKRKLLWEQYKRKETSYKELVRCLRGFYINIDNSEELTGEFLDQLNICWLYCPDEVIMKGYEFLNLVHEKNISKAKDRDLAMGNFVASIRNDLLSKNVVSNTKLSGRDFKHLIVNK